MGQIDTLNDIINNPNRMRESYVMKNHIELYNTILDYNKLDISFKEKLWYFYNKITKEVLCKCGNKTSFNRNFKNGYKKYCSAKCSQSDIKTKEKRKKTTQERYGVDNIAKLQEIKNKTEQTNIERYGHKSSFQNEDVRKKWKKNIQEKYGVDHIFQIDTIKETIKNTMIEKYGDHYTKTDDYINKTKKTNNKKYNSDWYSQTNEYSERVKDTNLNKYGNEIFFKSNRYKELMDIYLNDRNIKHITQSKEVRDKISKSKQKNTIDDYKNNFNISIISNDNGFIEYKSNCGHITTISVSAFYKRRVAYENLCTTCNPFYQYKHETEIRDFIESYNIYFTQNKFMFPKYQLDFFIPEYNIGIEHNGLYWHSELNKDKNYHQNKTKFFKEKGIDIIHIWEDDWIYKQDIIKSIIKNRLNIYDIKIYARDTEFKVIEDKKVIKDFLNNNHIQGYSNYSSAFGLFHKNSLISLMTFGYRTLSKDIELIRYCVKKNTNIIGGSAKLFKNSINNLSFNKLISYQDTAIFQGNMYQNLGFTRSEKNYIPYWWVINNKRENRQKYTKKKLIKEGYDPASTESNIMHDRGSYKIWGCEQVKWVYER